MRKILGSSCCWGCECCVLGVVVVVLLVVVVLVGFWVVANSARVILVSLLVRVVVSTGDVAGRIDTGTEIAVRLMVMS